ncbi:hypothetical protein NKJ46_04055 [Mesorhizobium sp. M0166]|uniref:hypothetical protein n=1 Tax=unclassified Mesorhizobium TaxID=325217 RepID=UPI00333C9672
MGMEWTISIEGTNEFGDICRREVRIDKSDERLREGDLGLSIDDGKKIMATLQTAVVTQEAEAYTLFRRVCPDCHNFRQPTASSTCGCRRRDAASVRGRV